MRKTSAASIAALLIAALSVANFAQDSAKPKGYQAVTKPSKEVELSFDRPGRIVELNVKEGDDVKAGELLARQDDSEEQAALAIDKSKAEDTTTVEAQKTIRDQKKQVYDDKIASNGTSREEISEAKLDFEVETAKVAISEIQHQQDILKYKQSSIAVEKLKLFCPADGDGVVAKLFVEKGESAEGGGNMRAVRIVRLDPLRIDVSVPLLEARKLKEGMQAEVTFADKVRVGTVTKYSPVGDAGSETILVRVEVPNPEKLTTGEKVFVNFLPAAAAGVAKP